MVVGRPDNSRIRELKHLAGHGVCAPPPPDVATLTLLSQFTNPARQPAIVEANSWDAMYKNLRDGKCAGAIVTSQHLDRIDRNLVKVLYRHSAMPNHALSAGPRITPELRNAIRQSLLTPQGKLATAKLRAAHNAEELVPARGEDYAGLGKLLKNSLYYY
jgi:ABC-type phosphate/phosphonate transport system substrate-binding protein